MMFGKLFGLRGKPEAKLALENAMPKAVPVFGQCTPSSPSTDPQKEFIRRQDLFLQSIGTQMRIGVDRMTEAGKIDPAFYRSWEDQLMVMSAAERGQFLVDWAHLCAMKMWMRTTEDATKIKFTGALPFTESGIRWPQGILQSGRLKQKIAFTDNLAKQYLSHVLESFELNRSSTPLYTSKNLTSNLARSINTPDEVLASRIRNAKHSFLCAKPLLKKLCPLESSASKADKCEFKEVEAVVQSFENLRLALRRLPGVWVSVPGHTDAYWGHLNQQLSPFSWEVLGCTHALFAALAEGFDVHEYRNHLLVLRDMADANLKALESRQIEIRLLSQIALALPNGERLETRNPYADIHTPESERHLFDSTGRPKIALIAACERRWLGDFFVRCTKLLEIPPKEGLSKKLVSLLPQASASEPTEKWLCAARTILNAEDLAQILADIKGQKPERPIEVLDDPIRSLRNYEYSGIDCREFHAKVWASHLNGIDSVEPLFSLAQCCYRKVPGVGPKNTRLGNAAVASLSLVENGAGVASLLQLQREVKYPNIKKFIAKQLAKAAKRLGPTVQNVMEMTVVDHGFA